VSKTNPLDGFAVERARIGYVGRDLRRPECILAEPDGTLWVADARGGVTRIASDGSQRFIGRKANGGFQGHSEVTTEDLEAELTQGTLPNGLAFAANGDILISNFGTDLLEIMTRDGTTRTLYDSIDGMPIGKVNFVLRDSRDRIWLTVSTRVNPWTAALTSRARDGYVAVVERGRLRVVADGFHFTNEIRLDAREEWLYIVETTGPHITRMRLDASDPEEVRLTDREIFGPSHLGGMPDGIAFDAHGNLWCTLIMVDQLIALTPDGDRRLLLDDGDPAASCNLLERFGAGTLRPGDMQEAHGTIAPWMASVTFGGPDLRTVFLGSLRGTRIPFFRAPVPGLPMIHWHRTR
jgi:sugar lactone lactonase YvrE